MKTLLAACVMVVSCTAGAMAEENETPDFASMDKAVLVILVENQYNEIARLREEIEDLKAQVAGEHGGSEAVISGDVTAIPDGSWVVTITDVSMPDVTHLQQEIEDLRNRLEGKIIHGGYRTEGQQTGVEARLRQAERDLQTMMSRGKYKNLVDSSGRTIPGSSNLNGYTDKELNDAKSAVRRLEGEKRGIDRKILDLERRIEAERNSINAQGVTKEGLPVTLSAAGVYASVGRTLQPDSTYTVTGRGVFGPTSGEITLKTAVLQATEVASE
jgi:hypothetical protein